jgi:hypothetical protein
MLGPYAKEAVGPLTAALNDSEALVRLSAARALGEIGPDAKDALPVLLAMSNAKGGKGWQGMAEDFWRGTVKRAALQIAPESSAGPQVR